MAKQRSDRQPAVCDICGKVLKDRSGLSGHKRFKHDVQPVLKLATSDPKQLNSDIYGEEPVTTGESNPEQLKQTGQSAASGEPPIGTSSTNESDKDDSATLIGDLVERVEQLEQLEELVTTTRSRLDHYIERQSWSYGNLLANDKSRQKTTEQLVSKIDRLTMLIKALCIKVCHLDPHVNVLKQLGEDCYIVYHDELPTANKLVLDELDSAAGPGGFRRSILKG